jgi:L-malate glycosyltransferase
MNRNRFQILVIDNSYGTTGAFRSIISLTETLNDVAEFVFILPGKAIVSALEKQHMKAFTVSFGEIQKSWRLLFYFPMLLVNTTKVHRIIRSNQIQILHVNDLYNMVGVLEKLINPKIKLVYHVRLLPGSYASFLYPIWTRLILRYADAIVCVSQAVYKALPESDRKILVYDALPVPDNFTEIAKDDTFTFFYPGNFIPGKGQNYAIEAFVLALPQLGNSRLVFRGGDLGRKKNQTYLAQLKSVVQQHDFQDKILFMPSADNLEKDYRSAHVVLNFSESESFSMTCLESLLYGTPVIATRCGGPEEIIDHGVNGLLVEKKTVSEMSIAMVSLYADNTLRENMAEKTMTVINKFSIKASAEKISTLYNSLLDYK